MDGLFEIAVVLALKIFELRNLRVYLEDML